MKNKILTLSTLAIISVACSQKTTDTVPNIQPVNSNTANAVTTPAAAPSENTSSVKTGTDITVNAGDDMKFDTAEIQVKSGEKIKITLKHTGKMTKDVMGHNFIILAQNISAADFAGKAAGAKLSDYIPQDEAKNIIAHTKLLSGGESDTIEFTAPAKGTYDFLCSFPGHYAMMKGKFIVE